MVNHSEIRRFDFVYVKWKRGISSYLFSLLEQTKTNLNNRGETKQIRAAKNNKEENTKLDFFSVLIIDKYTDKYATENMEKHKCFVW